MRGTGRDVEDMDPALPFKEQFIESDEAGASCRSGRRSSVFSGPYTAGYLLNAVDLQRTPDGIALKPPAERIYLKLFLRTW